MMSDVIKSLERLYRQNRLEAPIMLWGIGRQTPEVIAWLTEHVGKEKITAIIDNFKYTFYQEYHGIPVIRPCQLPDKNAQDVTVLLAVNYAATIRRQLEAYGIRNIYNLRDLSEETAFYRYDIPYHFTNRSKGKKNLCYVLAGYEPGLWDNTLQRIAVFADSDVDYCIVSSGKYAQWLDEFAQKNDWSYLYTEQNQVCYIQNLVIELHPEAEYIFKMDEDIFVGKEFFSRMLKEYHHIEQSGEYRIGFAVPVIPLNCCGYVSYLKHIGKIEEYEKRFGRAYKSRFSAVFDVAETAEFLWDTMDTFDCMAERFLQNEQNQILDCYYNIGCILFSRERWLMMGKWPERAGESGMGTDEGTIYQDNVEKDLSIYEIGSVLAGHLAFGHQKKRMLEYYREQSDKFQIIS